MTYTSKMAESDWVYPYAEPNLSGFLERPGVVVHRVHWEEYGNPAGEPVMYLHGGPGGGSNRNYARFFDPKRYRVILFDQRGCGQSEPKACDEPALALTNNTTADLIGDINALRVELDITGKMHVFGGSWGSTLALAYAIENHDKVHDLILRGVFLARRRELDYFYQGNAAEFDAPVTEDSPEGAYRVYPEEWRHFVDVIAPEERGDMVAAYAQIFAATEGTAMEKTLQDAAARAWTVWEGVTSNLAHDTSNLGRFENMEFAKAFAKIENHYFMNGAFFGGKRDRNNNYILENIAAIKDIPVHIVHGLHDQVCPYFQAEELVAVLAAAGAERVELIPTEAGHSWNERENAKALTHIMDRLPRMPGFEVE